MAFTGLAVVFWLDYAYRILNLARSRSDDRLLLSTGSQFVWIERLSRFRTVLTIILWLAITFHGLLVLNQGQKCPFRVPDRVQRYADALYGDKNPQECRTHAAPRGS